MAISDKKRAQLLADAAPALHDGEEVLDLTTGVAHVKRMDRTSHDGPRSSLPTAGWWSSRRSWAATTCRTMPTGYSPASTTKGHDQRSHRPAGQR